MRAQLRRYEYEEARRRGPGARVYAEENASGMLLGLHFTAAGWVEGQRISLHLTSGKGVGAYDLSWSIEPLPGGSRFTFEEEVELPYGPLGRLIGLLGERSSKAHVAHMLVTLKAMAEAKAQAPA
jgi:hypothetical protein